MPRPRIMLAAIAVSLAATSGLAEPLDKAVLEAPGRVWISETMIDSARSGAVIAAFPVLRFEAGRVEDSLLTVAQIYMPKSCEDYAGCEGMTNHPVFYSADYATDGTKLTFDKVTDHGFTTGRMAEDLLLRTEAVLTMGGKAAAHLEDGVLVVEHMRGTRRYLPFGAEGPDRFIGIVAALEVALYKYGECALAGHYARTRRANGELTDLDRSMLAMADYGGQTLAMERKRQRLRGAPDALLTDLPEADMAALKRLQFARSAAGFMVANAMRDMGDTPPAALPPLDDEAMKAAVIGGFPPFQTMEASERDAQLTEDLPLYHAARAAIPAMGALMLARRENEEAIRPILCP